LPRIMPRKKRDVTSLLFLLPALVFVIVVLIFPMLSMFYVSFRDYNISAGTDRFTGLQNYVRLLTDPSVWGSLTITGAFMLVCGSAEFGLGLSLAMALNRIGRFRRYIMAILLVPMLLPSVVVGWVWMFMFYFRGPLYTILDFLGLPQFPWISESPQALFSLMGVDIWQWTPFMTLVLFAGLQSLPIEPSEAATVDGASAWQIWRHVRLPLLRDVMLIAVLLRAMDIFRLFDIVSIITRGGPYSDITQTISYYIYNVGFALQYDLGYTSAVAIFVLVVVFAAFQRFHMILRGTR